MKNTLAITFLILPSILLGIKYHLEYEKKINISLDGLAIIILLTIYIIFILAVGANRVEGIEHIYGSSFDLKRFGAFFILPGISTSIVLFPKIAAEYTNDYISLAKSGKLNSYKFVGWLLFIFSILAASIYHV